MKSWDVRIIAEVVFEHSDNNLIIGHQLLRSVEVIQQAVAPASAENLRPRLEYEARNEECSPGTSSLQSPAEPDVYQPIEKYSSASPQSKSEVKTISITTQTISPQATDSANEGCIAIEHLQHRGRRTRRILCARGFFAARNNALLIESVYTSRVKLCETDICIETTKLLNNIGMWRNRRMSPASGAIATTYDVLLPKSNSFVVQSPELMVYEILDMGGIIALVVAAAVLTGGRANILVDG